MNPANSNGLVMTPAERYDVIFDFRRFAGRTLLMTNATPPGPVSTPAPPCRDLPADAVGVRARAEVSDGCHLCPAPFRGGMGTGGAAAGVIHPAAVPARQADMGSGPPAAT